MISVNVEVPYGIYFPTDLKDALKHSLRDHASNVLITSKNIACKYQHFVSHDSSQLGFDATLILEEEGESLKSLKVLEKIYAFLADIRLGRDGALFALGGGCIGDLVGFAAATYLRGVSLYAIPTTLVAMVDSSIGGKTGINMDAGKNLVGAFWQPKAVWIDRYFLNTLPAREFNAGMAEIIKYGLLGNRELFEKLETWTQSGFDAKHDALQMVIESCCKMKAAIVSQDPFEKSGLGTRALLNLGHTFGHAIEAVAGYGEYLHGEAVGIGLIMATRLSELLGYLKPGHTDRVKKIIENAGLPSRCLKRLSIDRLMECMRRDKKVKNGKLVFILLQAIGKAVFCKDVQEQLIIDLWNEFMPSDTKRESIEAPCSGSLN